MYDTNKSRAIEDKLSAIREMSGIKKEENPLFAGSQIRTFTGQYIDLLDPKPEHIHIVDIAHALSNMPRFAGHLKHFYSVGQHSLFCANRAPVRLQLAALLHDASEAYLMDIPSPLKSAIPTYKEIEYKLMKVIFYRYGLNYPLPDEIKLIDREALEWEWNYLALGKNNVSRSPSDIKRAFLYKFNALYNG